MGLRYYQRNSLKVLSNEETLRMVIEKKLSLIRFGDGEMYCMFGEMKNKSSSSNTCLKFVQKLLLDTFREESQNLLKCIMFPPFSEHSTNAKRKYIKGLNIYEYIYIKFQKNIARYYNFNKIYGSATTFKFNELDDPRVGLFKLLLKARNIVIVTSRQGRSFIPDDFLFLSNKVSYVEIPDHDAINSYTEIFDKCIKFDLDSLFLLSGGFAAKILALNLNNSGFQAVDIGYIPLFKNIDYSAANNGQLI